MKNAHRIACLLLAAVVGSSCGKKCPQLQGKTHFEVDKFQGSWYVISVLDESEGNTNWNETCSLWTFASKAQAGGYRADLSLQVKVQSGAEQGYRMLCTATDRNSSVARCGIFVGPLRLNHAVEHVVLATDYKWFALTRMCGAFTVDSAESFYSTVFILARKPYMSAEAVHVLKNVATSSEDVVEGDFRDLNNSGC